MRTVSINSNHDSKVLAEKATTEGAYLNGCQSGKQIMRWFMVSGKEQRVILVEENNGEDLGFVSSIGEMVSTFRALEQRPK